MKGKPIEPGCLAIIVGAQHCPENNGRVVRVIRRAVGDEVPTEAQAEAARRHITFHTHSEFDHSAARWWVAPVNGTLLWRSGSGRLVVDCKERSYKEKFLKRIDDGEDHSTDTPTAKTLDLDEVI